MTSELTVTTGGQLPAVQQQALVPLAAILQAAQDPNTDLAKMEGLIALYERMQDRQAKQAFDADMVACQKMMPRIKRDGRIINHKTNQLQSRYATVERLDECIRPIYEEFGFAVSFSCDGVENGKYWVRAKVRHRGGHVDDNNRVPLSLDQTGAKNDTQGMGSVMSYGRRYLLKFIFNVIEEGEDNDGNGAPKTITEQQASNIISRLDALGSKHAVFCQFLGISKIEDLPAIRYQDADRELTRAEKKASEGR